MTSNLLLILGAATEVTTIATGHNRLTALPAGQTAALASVAGGASDTTIQTRISDEQARWSGAALRPATLAPGEQLRGFVFAPVDHLARLVWMDVLAGERRFSSGSTSTSRDSPARRRT